MSDGPMPVEPIHRSTLGKLVTDRIRKLVISGHFEPGTQLNEVELANRFGVSRGPVREALQRLLQEGLLRREGKRGVSVPLVREEDVADLYFARGTIEAAALRVVLQRDPGRLARQLRDTVRLMAEAAEAGEWARVADLDIKFHSSVVAAAHSERLTRMYASIMDETRALFSRAAHYPGREDLVSEHSELATLLEQRNVRAALRALDMHIAQSVRRHAIESRARATGATDSAGQPRVATQ